MAVNTCSLEPLAPGRKSKIRTDGYSSHHAVSVAQEFAPSLPSDPWRPERGSEDDFLIPVTGETPWFDSGWKHLL